MTAIQFKAEQAANAILKADKAKLAWFKMPLASLPSDIQALAIAALNAEIAAKETKAALQSALDDKAEQKPGKRLVVTLGRDVGPNTDSILCAWADEAKGQTRVVSFDQFVKG